MNKHVAIKINRMVREDQDLRKRLFSLGYTPTEKDWDLLEQLDSKNIADLKKLISESGFATISNVGKRASYNVWLLVQHADKDLLFMKDYLKQMLKNKDDIDPRNIAYLYDRVCVRTSKKQRYGTQLVLNEKLMKQVPYPIFDIKNVDKRRKEYGLEPLESYLGRVAK